LPIRCTLPPQHEGLLLLLLITHRMLQLLLLPLVPCERRQARGLCST